MLKGSCSSTFQVDTLDSNKQRADLSQRGSKYKFLGDHIYKNPADFFSFPALLLPDLSSLLSLQIWTEAMFLSYVSNIVSVLW